MKRDHPLIHALLIIDMQNDFAHPGSPAAKVIPSIKLILDDFRKHQWPVFHIVRQYRPDGSDIEPIRLERFLNGPKVAVPGTTGCEIVDLLKPTATEYKIVKNRFSAFMNTELDLMLRIKNIHHLIICGTQFPVCIRTTVFDAVAYGYHVTLITDATAAQTEEIARANITDIQNLGVPCITTEQWLNCF